VIVADVETRTIVAGHHRKDALLAEGETTGPVQWITTDDEEHRRRILVGDNRATRLGQDDPTMLAGLLAEFAETEAGLAGTGYSGDDLAVLLDQFAEADPIERERVGPASLDTVAFRFGDIAGTATRETYDRFHKWVLNNRTQGEMLDAVLARMVAE
jgi:hypothetical protein